MRQAQATFQFGNWRAGLLIGILAGLVVGLLIAMPATAQDIYKQTTAEGLVVFTDNPDPGARIVTRYGKGSGAGAVPLVAAPPGPAAVGRTSPDSGPANPAQALGDDAQFSLETLNSMSTERAAAIDAREAARRLNAPPEPASVWSTLKFTDAAERPLRRYVDASAHESPGRVLTASLDDRALLDHGAMDKAHTPNWKVGAALTAYVLLMAALVFWLCRIAVRHAIPAFMDWLAATHASKLR